MLSKIRDAFEEESISPIKVVLMIVSILVSLALVVALFYTFFSKCDRLKFSYRKRSKHNPLEDEPFSDADIAFEEGSQVKTPIDEADA